MDEENPITDASNFHSAPEVGRDNDEDSASPIENEQSAAGPEATPAEESTTIAVETATEEESPVQNITVEEAAIEENVTPQPVAEIPEEPKAENSNQSADVADNTAKPSKVDNPSKILSQDQPYATIEQSTRNIAQLNTAPKRKANLLATVIIVLATVLITAAIVFVILKVTQGDKNNNQITPSVSTNDASYSTITCTREGSVDERIAVGDAQTIEFTIIATYTDGNMDDITESAVYTYTDAAAAKNGGTVVKDAYSKKLNNKSDPFSSTYSLNGSELTVMHFAEFDELTADNASVIGLTVDADGEVATDSDSVKKTYKAAGFTCKMKSD